MGNGKRRHKIPGRQICAVLIAVFTLLGGYAAYRIITTEADYASAQNEYSALRIFAPFIPAPSDSDENGNGDSSNRSNQKTGYETKPDLSDINRDYIGWIRIDGTEIDYPIVQSRDNTKYLNTTFTGENNPSGTIFMDAECSNSFDFFTIIHGHNMRDGSMFADLHLFRDSRFRVDHSEVLIFTPDGGLLIYKIFAVKMSNINDEVFNLPLSGLDERVNYFDSFGLTRQELRESMDILVLATHTEGNRNERLLIFTARVRE